MVAAIITSTPAPVADLPLAQPNVPSAPGPGVSFSDKVARLVESTNDTQVHAEQVATDYANGSQNDLHGTMIAMAEADISFRLLASVRNKCLDAYREIMRMGA